MDIDKFDKLWINNSGTIMPPVDHINPAGVNHLLPWIPKWLDLNIMIPLIATAIVVAVGILVICVAITRRRSDDPRGGPKDVYCRFHSSFIIYKIGIYH